MNKSQLESIQTKNYHARLFKNIFQSDHFLDAVLWADGKTIQVHRVILAAGSPYFLEMLKNFEKLNKRPFRMYFKLHRIVIEIE